MQRGKYENVNYRSSENRSQPFIRDHKKRYEEQQTEKCNVKGKWILSTNNENVTQNINVRHCVRLTGGAKHLLFR